MNKSIFSLIGIALIVAVIFSGCIGNPPAPAPPSGGGDVTPPSGTMQQPTPDELAQSVSATAGVSDSELTELDSLVDGIESNTTELQESNI